MHLFYQWLGGIGIKIVDQGQPKAKMQHCIQEIIKAKSTGHVAQVVESLRLWVHTHTHCKPHREHEL
jgi:hypothetical protein